MSRQFSGVVQRFVVGVLSLGVIFAVFGCKSGGAAGACNPEEVREKAEIKLVLQSGRGLNPDEDGNSLPTEVRLYQLKDGSGLVNLDFNDVWQNSKEALGAALLAEQKWTIYPGQDHTFSIKPEKDVSHFLLIGIFRRAVGNTWYKVYELPKRYGEAVCGWREHKKEIGSPCFYVVLDRFQVEGGATPPSGFTAKLTTPCAAASQLEPPPKKQKKKRKKFDPSKAKVPELPKTPELPKAPELPKVPELPKAPQLPKAP